ncbi:hypothetical protein BOX15_Mlig008240g2 [Macrostomum lignano]|uniref:Uncharacterized protein n=1 Tax=Macrostomum lignano TaxID=282301 RepID=A0A267FUL4_9PLAT|nr:hypothetical protein BOX15_Mlig008240g2 [Macrostomum lignano]
MYRMSNFSFDTVSALLKKVIEKEPSQPNAFLSEKDVEVLLHTDSQVSPLEHPMADEPTFCYPYSPLYLKIAAQLLKWTKNGSSECQNLPKFYMLEENEYVEERNRKFSDLNEEMKGMPTLWSDWTEDERIFKIRSIILRLGGKRGLMDLLTVRCTTGTILQFPAPRSRLMAAFDAPCNDKSSLTQGARALTKHFHRDQKASFWGVASGTEAEKNEHARSVVLKIIDSAAWINIHQLPGQLPIMEVRHPGGYGARWDPNGETFRGFLEPMQPEGWLNKYRH